MPEIRFQIEWPDGTQDLCYSPSLIVKEYFTPDTSYRLQDFVERSRQALTIASDRVKAKYGRPCSLALGQLQQIESIATKYAGEPSPDTDTHEVKVLQFFE